MPRSVLAALLSTLAVALLAPAAADARVVLVATGDGTVTMTDVATNQVAARLPVGGVSRGVVVAPDGSRGYVAAGLLVQGLDLGTRLPVGAIGLRGTVRALAISADGRRLYAARRGAIDVIDATTFTLAGSIRLPSGSEPRSIAVSSDGTRAAVVLDRRHIGIASLVANTLIKRIEIDSPSAWPIPRPDATSGSRRPARRPGACSSSGRMASRARATGPAAPSGAAG